MFLQPGQQENIVFTIMEEDVSIWDVEISNWSVVNGSFNVYVGSSSRDIRLTGTFTV